jgi:hypothetical protein
MNESAPGQNVSLGDCGDDIAKTSVGESNS